LGALESIDNMNIRRITEPTSPSVIFGKVILPILLVLASIGYIASFSKMLQTNSWPVFILLLCISITAYHRQFSHTSFLTSILLAWLYCILCHGCQTELALGSFLFSIEKLLLGLALLLSIALSTKSSIPILWPILQVGITLFLLLTVLPVLLVERTLACFPWMAWIYGICFLQIIACVNCFLEYHNSRRMILLYCIVMLAVLIAGKVV
jgi:hypothetical protein